VKRLLIVLIVALVISGSTAWTAPKLEKVRLSEVVRSVFYAPQYVAISKGFFKDEGLEIQLSTAWGADKGAAALVSGSVDIGFFGPEAAVYIYNQGAGNYLVAFAQLTKGDGSFLLARRPMPDFEWHDVKGKTIIGGRKGGVPEMLLEHVLRENGIRPHLDVEILQNIQFTATAGAFKSGVGDYLQLFEPTVSVLEREGIGHVVASFRTAGGVLPYTVYHTRKDMLKKKAKMLQRFTNAIYRGQIWVQNHSVEQIVAVISDFFPDNDQDLLTRAVKRYKGQDTWGQNPIMTKAAFNRLQEIIYDAGELKRKVPYEKMVNTEFAMEAVKNIQE
jgi:NitT/TauT family transport system substrate-binding protein